MTSKEEVLKNLMEAIINGDADNARLWAEEALKAGIDAYEAIMKGCSEAMKIVGEKYEKREYFIPEVLLSVEALQAAVEVLRPHIKMEKVAVRGTIVIGTVFGDIHDIGKNLVKTMLEAAGFNVIDLGRDVPHLAFVEAAQRYNADVVAMSALMTTTAPGMKNVIDLLREKGLRDKVKVIIGGAATSQDFAREIGADAWAPDAAAGVEKVKELLGLK